MMTRRCGMTGLIDFPGSNPRFVLGLVFEGSTLNRYSFASVGCGCQNPSPNERLSHLTGVSQPATRVTKTMEELNSNRQLSSSS